MKIFKYIFFYLSLISQTLFCEDYSGEVKSLILPENRIVNIGPCLVGDTIQANFLYINKGIKDLYIDPLTPTFAISKSPNGLEEHFRLFDKISPNLPLIVKSNLIKPDTLKIVFNAKDTLQTKTVRHEAYLEMGLKKNDKRSDVVVNDTFLLVCKKTPYFLCGYDDFVNFDSVYMNPTQPKFLKWKVKNTWINKLSISSTKVLPITSEKLGKEIFFPAIQVGTEVNSKTTNDFQISYSPLDKGVDTAMLKIFYHPLPSLYPDSTDFAFVKAFGIGVEQELKIVSSNFDFRNDTIDLGSLKPFKNYQLNLSIKNTGNIPFGTTNQNIFDENQNIDVPEFSIEKKFGSSGINIKPDSSSEVTISFNSKEIKNFFVRYSIESDILNRQISGVNQSKRFKMFYIKAKIISPIIEISNKVVNFGTVIFQNVDCPTSRDSSIIIRNIGNDVLRIIQAYITNEDTDNKFSLKSSISEIEPYTSQNLIISFNSNGNQQKDFASTLVLVTNQSAPFDTVKIQLIAKGLPPVVSTLMIPDDIKSQPGRLINVPVLLISQNKDAVSLANQFSANLTYNRSIIEYVGTRNVNSAFEGAINNCDPIQLSNKDYVSLDFEMPNQAFFKPLDTLFYIKFKTFLGDDISTPIVLNNPLFSDGICKNLIKSTKIEGNYTTDSVCGLESKLGPTNSKYFDFNFASVTNNSLKINYSSKNESNLVLNIYSIYGELVLSSILTNNSEKENKLQIDNLTNGVYIIELSNGKMSKFKKVFIIK